MISNVTRLISISASIAVFTSAVAAQTGGRPFSSIAPIFIAAVGALFATWLAFRILLSRKKK